MGLFGEILEETKIRLCSSGYTLLPITAHFGNQINNQYPERVRKETRMPLLIANITSQSFNHTTNPQDLDPRPS